MCEFCPRSGRCCVCEHFSVDLTPSAAPVVPDPSSGEGFVVEHQGVAVRFDRHSDALACLGAFPTARVS